MKITSPEYSDQAEVLIDRIDAWLAEHADQVGLAMLALQPGTLNWFKLAVIPKVAFYDKRLRSRLAKLDHEVAGDPRTDRIRFDVSPLLPVGAGGLRESIRTERGWPMPLLAFSLRAERLLRFAEVETEGRPPEEHNEAWAVDIARGGRPVLCVKYQCARDPDTREFHERFGVSSLPSEVFGQMRRGATLTADQALLEIIRRMPES